MKKEMPKIDINDINKVRAQALRWTKRLKESKLLKWESLPYYCMRIGRCMRKLGFSYTIFEVTDVYQRDVLQLSLEYTVDTRTFHGIVDESETLYRNEKDNVNYALPLAQLVVECCQQLADYIYEQSETEE
ncbi:MAG: hypothetical protein IJJ98_15090 [Prevotella sp.]|nr:hypothetical protein [Prevotella sp.]